MRAVRSGGGRERVFHVKHDSREAVLARLGASAAEAARLDALARVLETWGRRINLVAPSTLPEVWTRHIEDSAQVLAAAPEGARRWADLGAGAGFPGLVVAALAVERRPELAVTLVESDARKCAFLAAAAREMGVSVAIRPVRIEALAEPPFDVISARALAALPKLLDWAAPHLAPGGAMVLPKGEGWRAELTRARAHWHMACDARASTTHPGAVVLVLTEIARAQPTRA